MEEDAGIVQMDDTGIGIAVNDLAHHVTAFRQGSEGKTRKYEGSGLGLKIVKKVVDQTNASIDASTTKGAGTCVTVSFPTGPSTPQTPESPVTSEPPSQEIHL